MPPMTTATSDPDFKPGLEGVIAFETEIAEPD
jgi:citrate synthase